MTLRAAAEQALNALDYAADRVFSEGDDDPIGEARAALRAALAAEQPQPDPKRIAEEIVAAVLSIDPDDLPDAAPPAAAPSEAQLPPLPPLPIGEAEVTWFDPQLRIVPERPGKIIDASMAFMDAAPLGTRLYSAEQMREYARAALAAEQPQPEAQPVAWREHVEQRIRSWRQRTMNRYGDRLAIDDYMSADAIDDLVDYVCDEYAAPPPSAPCPHIRSSGVGDHATHWCGLAEQPQPEPSRTLTQDERSVFDAALRRSTKVVAPEPSEAEVEAGITAMDDVYSAHPAGQRPEITDQDRAAMRDALRAAAAARTKC